MWQSRVEIKYYSVTDSDCIAELLLRVGLICRLIRYSCIYEVHTNPALSGSSTMRHFKHSGVIEIRKGITFDFYMDCPK